MNRVAKYLGSWDPQPCVRTPSHRLGGSDAEWLLESGGTRSAQPMVELIGQLVRELHGRATRESDLQRRVKDLEERVAAHQALFSSVFGQATDVAPGTFETWLETTAYQTNLAGQHVAFSRRTGLLASASTLDELMEKIGMIDTADVDIGFVPAASM